MTVIAAVITSYFTVHATDSFITTPKSDGALVIEEAEETKIIPVPAWRGAISYWGLATHKPDWRTLNWLRTRTSKAGTYSSAKDFAEAIASELTTALRARTFRSIRESGIGMHFTAYEKVNGYWIPELFQIRNWEDERYSTVRNEIRVTRETFGALSLIPI